MKTFDFHQGTDAWLDARCGKVTGSNMDRIITPAKGEFAAGAREYAYELIAEQLMGPRNAWVTDYVSRDMQNGIDCESEARSYFELEMNLDVQQVGFCEHDNGRWGVSPDGLIGEDGGLELKCPAPKTQIRYLIDGGLPREYAPQVHGAMIVTGRDSWYFLSYCKGLPPHLVHVTPNEFTQKLRDCLAKFDAMFDELYAKVCEGREAYIQSLIANAKNFEGPLAALVPPSNQPQCEPSYF